MKTRMIIIAAAATVILSTGYVVAWRIGAEEARAASLAWQANAEKARDAAIAWQVNTERAIALADEAVQGWAGCEQRARR